MRIIIYWLTLMVILPLLYLFWRKKTWRLILGIIILIVLIVGLILPGKMVFSILKKELKRVEEKEKRENWIDKRMEKRGEPWQKMEGELKITLQQEINPENREKIQLEKEILKLREERKQISQEIDEVER